MTTHPRAAETVAELHQRAMHALQDQREAETVDCWQRIVAIAPDDIRANAGLGRWAYRVGEFGAAVEHLTRVAQADPQNPRHWIEVALIHKQRGDAAAEEAALFQALTRDPQDLPALLMRGELYERQGRMTEATDAYMAAATVAPPMDRLSADLRGPVAHALSVRDAHQKRLANFMDSHLASALQDHAGEDLSRFQLSLDILLGRKRRFDAAPSRYFVPQLAPVEFFDRALFPWMDAIEAGTEQIRDELLAVLRADKGITPYIEYRPDQPVHEWAGLNHNPAWSAYHLWKNGQPVESNAAQCPETMRLLAQSPRPDQPGRTPVAMYSLLKPHTAIPPHVGASNARLVCHLPLVVPPGCMFRVGNSVRSWEVGRAWAFDDTIEHEARNDSDQLRAILIWDTWHPALTLAERGMITAMNTALNAFAGVDTAFNA